jgi:ABC-2 type transport system ATP-binding protein
MLTLTRVSKAFYQRNEPKAVVDQVTLSVKPGQVFGFLGLNGAGKTTTIKMIMGLLFPDAGTIRLGKKPHGDPEARRIIGFMPEQPQFYQHLRAVEVLDFVGALFGLEPAIRQERAQRLLLEVGLSDATDVIARRFSKGMHQRLSFAAALMNDPALLVLDEPLDGLDPLGRQDFKRLILGLKKQGKTIFFSSHVLSDVAELCDEVAILHHGAVIAQGVPKNLTKPKQTLEEYFVETVTSHEKKS